jgi:hypothetical protein
MKIMSVEEYRTLAPLANFKLLGTTLDLLHIGYSIQFANSIKDVPDIAKRMAENLKWDPEHILIVHGPLKEDNILPHFPTSSGQKLFCVGFNVNGPEALIKAINKVDNIKVFL